MLCTSLFIEIDPDFFFFLKFRQHHTNKQTNTEIYVLFAQLLNYFLLLEIII